MAKLLLIAPGGDPDDVGESWVVNQWVTGLAARHETTLLTYYKRTRQPLAGRLPGVRVVEWPDAPLVHHAERLNSMLKPGYLPFYFRARHWIRQAMKRGERFDLAHQPVPVAMRYPSPAAGLGIPLIIGPVGGSLEAPGGFADGDTAPWYVGLRRLDSVRLRRDRLLRRTYESADCVVGIAPYVQDLLAGVKLRRFAIMSETGIADLGAAIDRSFRPDPVRLLFVGRLIRTKAARDVIAALGLLRDLPVVFDVVGDGFDRAACERLVAELEVGDRVTFHGALPRAEVARHYEAADVFVFPSYREPGGNVVFEAMAAGLPLVVCDRGGPGNVVDASCGIRLPAENPTQYAAEIAAAIRLLVTDRRLRLSLGDGARRRAADIALWPRKVDRMDDLYRSVLGAAEPGRNSPQVGHPYETGTGVPSV